MSDSAMAHEVTLRLYQSLKIEESLFRVLLFLKDYFPIDNLHVGVFDASKKTVRYLASSTPKGGLLIDETIRLSNEAVKEADMMIPGKVLLFNNPLEKKLIQEVTDAKVTTSDGKTVFDPGSVFSAMTLVLDIGKPLKGMCTMLVKGKNLYNRDFQKRFNRLEKPMTNAILNLLNHREVIEKNKRLNQANNELRQRIGHLDAINIVGAKEGLSDVMLKASKVAPTDSPVLITGETGTGKEVLAHAIHKLSSRKNSPIVCINCGAIPSTLAESELFGHEKGAFTGAVNKKRGYFEQAAGGTIFLDEVAELTSSVQVKLLRVLQEKTLTRVGGTKTISVDVRVIAATNRNLEKLIIEKKFRKDLWFRLNVFPMEIPPLRKRKEDIPALIDYFTARKALEMHLPFTPEFDDNAVQRLTNYSWPGNIRELENIIERSLITSAGKPLSFNELTLKDGKEIKKDNKNDFIEPLDEMIISHIKKALKKAENKISGAGSASEILGINPSTLRGKMRKYNIDINN